MLRKFVIFLLLVIFSDFVLYAADYYDGNIRLSLNEKKGSISLYYMTDSNSKRYEPLFYSKEPKSSYISVNLDGKVHRLDQSGYFRTRTETIDGNPVIVYESYAVIVRVIFTPVRTVNSSEINGVNITVVMQNKGDRSISAGLRFLIDTHLGEGRNDIPISTNNQSIAKETIIEGSSGETYWISKDSNLSLMGSIVNPFDKSSKIPDYIHIANWRRLNNASWKLKFSNNRSFTIFPYSIRDSAVCYYYEPAVLEAGRSFIYSISLTTEDTAMYDLNLVTKDRDDSVLQLLYKLKKTLEQFIAGDIILYEDDLDEIENSIDSHKIKR
ncbi:MAG: hypothetical protein FWF68_11220 [Spirochaetes bacterium]|nr:hypothetical protein [Spirochaetota bacterium]